MNFGASGLVRAEDVANNGGVYGGQYGALRCGALSEPVAVLRGGRRGAYAPPNRPAGAMLCSHTIFTAPLAYRM